MDKFIAFTIPGPSGNIKAVVPSSIPANLQGDFSTSGQALIQLIINSLFLLIAATALIFIIFSGIRLITSGGELEAVKNSRRMLIYSIVGLVVATMAFFLVRTLITFLGGDTGSSGFWKLQ